MSVNLRGMLQGFAHTSHLPAGFNISGGVRPLFPASRKNSISHLKTYLYSRNGGPVADGRIEATFQVFADGSGRWLYRAIVGNINLGVNQNSAYDGRYGIGFVFDFSENSTGHGYMYTDQYQLVNTPTFIDAIAVTVEGFDPWITNHWPELFSKSVILYISDGTPHIDHLAGRGGFSGWASLQGARATVASAAAQLKSGGGSGEGGSGFPGPIDWGTPPDDGEDGQ